MVEFFGYDANDFRIMVSVFSALGLFGLLGNVMSIIVWSRPQMTSSTTILLITLAVTDILNLLCTFGLVVWPSITFDNYSPVAIYIHNFIYPYVVVVLGPTLQIAEIASIYLTLVITFERYIAVCDPFKCKRICTYSRGCKSAALVLVASIVFNLSRFCEQKVVVAQLDIRGNVVAYTIGYTALGKNRLYNALYLGWLVLFIRCIIPLAGIIGMNASIYRALERAKRSRENLTNFRKSENRLTLMLIYVVVEFLVCYSTDAAFAINRGLMGYAIGPKGAMLAPVKIFAIIFNSSSNFVTYCILGGSFRRTFLETFCCYEVKSQQRRPVSPSGKRYKFRLHRTNTSDGTPV